MNLETPLIIGVLFGFSVFAFVTVTAFPKVSIVFLILRNALSLQQTPTNLVIFTLSAVISLLIVYPIILIAYNNVQEANITFNTLDQTLAALEIAQKPVHEFLVNNTDIKYVSMVYETVSEAWSAKNITVKEDSFVILIPSFLISEISKAFQIGFLIYLPFLAIDLVVTVILMAMGLMMVQPTVLSTPFKILLFVMVDGLTLLFAGLVDGYII